MSDTRGFSTLEILIAMAIMISTLSAVVVAIFGNQSSLGQASADAGALEKAQAMLETEQANARKDFRLVTDSATTSDGLYQRSLSVADMPDDPYTTKRLTAFVSWQDQSNTTRNVSLTTLVTDFDDPSTLDTCDSSLAGDWTKPSILNYLLSPGNLLPTNAKIAAANTIGALDAYRGKLYVVDAMRSAKTDDSFFIFDISNPKVPQYLASIDSATSSTDGMNAITVAGNYAYAANSHGANFKTCKPAGNCSQLQIFDISNPVSPALVDDFLVPTSSSPYVVGSGGQGVGNALFYADGYIYLGLSKTATGPEFDIIDVHDPAHPAWVGGYAIGATINQIYVRSGYAYLATDDQSRKLMIFDVHDPRSPLLVSSLDPKGTTNQSYGYSLYAAGDELFFGMSSTSVSGAPELAEFDIAHSVAPTFMVSREVGASILGIFVRDSRLFLLTSIVGAMAALQSFDSADLDGTSTSVALPGTGAWLDCEGNYFYAGSNNGSQGYVSVIGPASNL